MRKCFHRSNVLGAYCWDCDTNLAMRQHDITMPHFPVQMAKGKTLHFTDCELTYKERLYINNSVMKLGLDKNTNSCYTVL